MSIFVTGDMHRIAEYGARAASPLEAGPGDVSLRVMTW